MENLLRRLDLTSLRLFIAVCQEASIARAAERELIAPSAVSRRIADMEALIGLPLIERHTRGVAITPVGQTVLRHARTVVRDIEAMAADLSRLYAGVQGKVKLVANLSAIVQFLPEDIAAFQRLFPDVDVDIEEEHSPDVVRLVREHAADFGICNQAEMPQDLRQLPYRRDRLAVMLPSGHPLTGRPHLHLSDITGETFVSLRENSALTRLLAEQARSLGVTLSVRIRVASLDALCRMTHAGLGIAVLPQQIAELYLQSLDVAVRPLSDPWAQRKICLVLPTDRPLSPTAERLVSFLSQEEP